MIAMNVRYSIWGTSNIRSSTATPKWSKLYDASPEELIRADIDGDGQDDLVANLGAGNGLWVWSDAATPKWRKIRGQIRQRGLID